MVASFRNISGIKALTHSDLVELFDSIGEPRFRVNQLETWIYSKHVSSYDEMTNLPKALRSYLSNNYPLHSAQIIKKFESKDGSIKYLIRYSDGTMVEAVGIPTSERLTVCFSTQAGCQMECAFCATGKNGFSRNLAPGEIYDQVALVSKDFGRRVSNVVGMGQGEPFMNYSSVLGAIRFMNSPNGENIGARHITISTCGILPGIYKFSDEQEQFTLAISLHSAVQKTRNYLMPKVSKYPLPKLKEALKVYTDKTGRRPTFEYSMIKDVNDTDIELTALLRFCDGILCHVNLIPLNLTDERKFQPSDRKRINLFSSKLKSNGIEVSIRNSRGSDINGACGQLMQQHLNR